MSWKIQDRATTTRPRLFCPTCNKCMYTKEDIQSRDFRGICNTCTTNNNSLKYHADEIVIVLNEHD